MSQEFDSFENQATHNKKVANILSILGALIAIASIVLLLMTNNQANNEIQRLENANKQLEEANKKLDALNKTLNNSELKNSDSTSIELINKQ